MAPKLDKPSSLTVPLLRAELAKRGISTTGMLKPELVARLTEALAEAGGGGGGDDVDGDVEMVRPWLSSWGLVHSDFRAPSASVRSVSIIASLLDWSCKGKTGRFPKKRRVAPSESFRRQQQQKLT